MILVDTSIWIDHLRANDGGLASLLENGKALCHPFIIGELALGQLRQRSAVLSALQGLRQAILADHVEVMGFIDSHNLGGTGIGYVDAHLLASTRLTPDAQLWTRDRRLAAVAERLGLDAKL